MTLWLMLTRPVCPASLICTAVDTLPPYMIDVVTVTV